MGENKGRIFILFREGIGTGRGVEVRSRSKVGWEFFLGIEKV